MKQIIIEVFLFAVYLLAIAGFGLMLISVAWNIKQGLRSRKHRKRRKQFKRFRLSEEDKRIINAAYERGIRNEQGRD